MFENAWYVRSIAESHSKPWAEKAYRKSAQKVWKSTLPSACSNHGKRTIVWYVRGNAQTDSKPWADKQTNRLNGTFITGCGRWIQYLCRWNAMRVFLQQTCFFFSSSFFFCRDTCSRNRLSSSWTLSSSFCTWNNSHRNKTYSCFKTEITHTPF